MCGKGSQTTTSSSAPNPVAMGNYEQLLSRAAGVAGLPFQQYGGEFVAPINQQQQAGIGNINQNAGFAQPFIQQAAGYANQAAQPISGSQINQYLSPYTQDVVNATEAQFNQQNQVQQNQLTGNAAAQGALGGDRVGVAQAALAGQQQLSEAPTIAGLYNQGYSQALEEANTEQQAMANAAYSLGNLGVAGQNAALTGANAQLGAGTLEQSTQQALDQALYNQFLAQQGFPYQQTQWLAGIDTGVGSQMGGTSQTTGPPPNQTAQYLGLGIAGLGLLNRGGAVHRDAGGRIRGFDMGGTPYAGGASYVPTVGGLTIGQGAPKPPGLPGQGQSGQPDPFKLASSTIDLGKKLQGLGNGGLFGNSDVSLDEATQAGAEAGLSPDELGLTDTGGDLLGGGLFRRGGRIAGFAMGGYADGGSPDMPIMLPGEDPPAPDFDSRFNASSDYASRNSIPTYPRIPYSGADDNEPDAGFVNPLSVKGQPQNLTGPIIPPGGTGGTQAPGLAPATDVPSRPVAGVGQAPMSYGPSPDLSGGQAAAAPSDKQRGFGGLFGNPLHVSDDMRKALLAAGFGMLSSRSPFLGNAIGEGGLAGLSAYTGSQKEAFNEDKALKQLQQHADETSKKLEFETKKQQSLEEYRKAQLERSDKLLDFRKQQADPEVAAKLAAAKKPQTGTAFSEGTVDMMADAIRAGNTQVLTNLGAGAMKAENVAKVWNRVEEKIRTEGGTGADLAAARANFNAQMGAAKSQAVRQSNVEANIVEAQRTFPLAIEASDRLPRSQFVPWNRVVQAVQSGTSSPELAQFHTAVQGVITAYSQAMARAGVATVDGRHAAETLLNTAQGPDAFKAVLGQMSKEMEAARAAPEQVRQEILSRISGRPAQGAAPGAPAGGAAPVTGGGGGAGFTGRTATNPQTGQKLRETTSGQWVP